MRFFCYLRAIMPQLPEINSELLNFVERNATTNPAALRLVSRKGSDEFDREFAIVQVEARRKASSKLKDYIALRNFIFPDSLSAEQATHQKVARFHASLVKPGVRVLDMTCGLGIDSFEIAIAGASVTTCDLDPLRAAAARHNTEVLKLANITVVEGDSVKFLRTCGNWDCIIVDPARRDSHKMRTYAFKDCLPDVTEIADLMVKKAPQVLIKASPMLDIKEAIRELPHCSRIFAVSIKGECKEVLIELRAAFDGTPDIEAVIMGEMRDNRFVVPMNELGAATSHRSDTSKFLIPGFWLYEPDATVMKMAPWRALENRFPSLRKLASNTHLFVSPNLFTDFPGRIVRICAAFSPNSREAKALKGEKWNIISRNAPLTPDQLKKKLGLRDGGPNFLYYLSVEGSRPQIVTGEPMR